MTNKQEFSILRELSENCKKPHKDTMTEAGKEDSEEYKEFFKKALAKFGVTEPDQLKGDKKKEFFDYIDANWKSDTEEKGNFNESNQIDEAGKEDSEEYKAFFKKMLTKYKVKKPEDLKPEDRKKFYDEVDAGWKSDEEENDMEESTGVTNFNPKSQGGTRKELLTKLAKTKDPKDAEAALKAGATQAELKTAMKEGVKSLAATLSEMDDDEESNDDDDDTEKEQKYEEFFKKMLKKWGIKSPDELDDKDQEKFFDEVDKGWNTDSEAGEDGSVTESEKEQKWYNDLDAWKKEVRAIGFQNKMVPIVKIDGKVVAKWNAEQGQGWVIIPSTPVIDEVAVIDTKMSAKQLGNFRKLPKEIQDEINSVEKIASSGFTEVIGYNGRQAIFSMGGSWNEKANVFSIDSYGSKNYTWNPSKGLVKLVKESLRSSLLEAGDLPKDEPQRVIKKKESKESSEADIKIDDREEEAEQQEVTIEFPEGVYLELEFSADVNVDQVKLKAQKLYQAGGSPVDVALALAKDFNADDWFIADISTLEKNGEDEESDEDDE